MEITITTYLILCPMLFLAGLVDAIGGGGGLISLPAYLIAGFPAHTAIATNKMSSACGTALATWRFIKAGLVNFKIAVPSVITAVLGSSIGANLSLLVDESVLMKVLIFMLPVSAVIVLNKKLFRDNETEEVKADFKTIMTAMIAALIVGCYDGFYGPGTGTFLLIAFTVFAKLGVRSANAQAKVINLTTNITALTVFFLNGQVFWIVGLVGAVCNMAGGYIGAGMVMKNGAKIARPSILFVLILLVIKIITEF